MDAFNDPRVEEIVLQKSSQVGATDGPVLNAIGYYMDIEPSSILLVVPTVYAAEVYSKERIQPMLRDTPALSALVAHAKSRDSDNTLTNKKFPGGRLNLVGANSPTGLAMRAIRIFIGDEIDKFPVSTGPDGDPIGQGENRQKTFWNRKRLLTSTPTIKHASRIEAAYEPSSQGKLWCPCPHCGKEQELRWKQFKWQSSKTDDDRPEGVEIVMQDPKSKHYHYPETARYECEHCREQWTEAARHMAVRNARWIHQRPEVYKIRGFIVWEGMSLLVTMTDIVVSFLKAKVLPETLRVWINQVLGETYEISGDKVDPDHIYASHRTDYDSKIVPAPASLISIGVDVQGDRIELETLATSGEPDHLLESWSLRYDVIYGDPKQKQVWMDLDDLLKMEYEHANGNTLRPAVVCVDSGAFTDEVYAFCKRRYARRVYAVKGKGGAGLPNIANVTDRNEMGCQVFTLGSDSLKSLVYSRLAIDQPGPGFCHFPLHYQKEYFEQLASEIATTTWSYGQPTIKYILKQGVRNEGLDCRCYAVAGIEILRPNWGRLMQKTYTKAPAPKPAEKLFQRRKARGNKRRGGWATNW